MINNYNRTTIRKGKEIIDNTGYFDIQMEYYSDYRNEDTYVLIRDDAKKFTYDWVSRMDNCVGKIGKVIDVMSGNIDVEVEEQYPYIYNYRSLIPVKLLNAVMRPTYQPKTFVESNSVEKFIFEAKRLKYINIVDHNLTEYNYRFKTLKEFKNEYGYFWRDDVPLQWIYEMDAFFGKNVPKEIKPNLYEKEDIVFVRSGFNFSLSMMIPNKIAPMTYTPRTFIRENADFINIDGYELVFRNDDAIPFSGNEKFEMIIGDNGATHTELDLEEAKENFREDYYVVPEAYEEKFGNKPSDPITIKEIEWFYDGEADFDGYYQDMFSHDTESIYLEIMNMPYVGRLWTNSKIISFWNYPDTKEELKKVVESLEKEIDIKIWNNGWKILVIYVKNVNDTSGMYFWRDLGVINNKENSDLVCYEKLIPLESFEQSINPDKKEWTDHIKSPMLKKKKKTSGYGSEKPVPGAKENEPPVETRHRLYQESINNAGEFIKNVMDYEYNTLIWDINSDDVNYPEDIDMVIKILHDLKFNTVEEAIEESRRISNVVFISLPNNINNFEYGDENSVHIKPSTVYNISLSFLQNEMNKVFPKTKASPRLFAKNIIEIFNKLSYNPANLYKPKTFIYDDVKKLKDFE